MIDVIIPAYNAHDTIRNTLRSLSIQRLAKELCVLIIDDGSERDYAEEVAHFRKDFKSMRQIVLSENHGVGYCRQLGLKQTRNPHIYFIDSDDLMVSPYTFNYFLQRAFENTDYALIYGNVAQEFYPNNSVGGLKSFQNGEVSIYTHPSGNTLFLHGKMYSRKFIDYHKLKFAELRSNEDLAFNAQVFTLAQDSEIIHLPIVAVTTLCNGNSITRSENSTRKYLLGSVIEIHDGYESMLHAFNTIKKSPARLKITAQNFPRFIHKFLNFYLRWCHAVFNSIEERELCRLICAKYYKDILIPIIQGTPFSYSLPNKWETNDYGQYLLPTEQCPHPEINSWAKQALNDYNEETFNSLCNKYITKEGYNCQQTKMSEER